MFVFAAVLGAAGDDATSPLDRAQSRTKLEVFPINFVKTRKSLRLTNFLRALAKQRGKELEKAGVEKFDVSLEELSKQQASDLIGGLIKGA